MGKIADSLLPAVRAPRATRTVEQQRASGPLGGGLLKWAVTHNLTAPDLVKAIEREAARTTDIRDLAVRLTGPDPTMGAPFAAWDDNVWTAAQMGPGAPATPFPLGGEPRQFQYRVGFNFPSPPDTDRGVDSQLLRVLADSFDLVRLCIEIRKEDLKHLEWDIVPREKNRAKREQWMNQNAETLDRVKQFFAWPEAYTTQDAAGHWVRRGKTKWEDWLGALLEDFFVGDWLTIWPRHTYAGDLRDFERVDGSTIKPLLDLEGRVPEPPHPAYQQYLFGVPRASFTLEELVYRPRTVRNHTVFGFSHVEQMLVLINLALRFQMWETQQYTDSSLPLGLLEFPENFSPDQIEAVVETLNAALSGLSGERQKFHGVPSGTKWNAIKPFEWDETFAQYLVEYTAAMFRLNAQKLGFMPGRGGQGLGGKGFAEQQTRNDEDKATIPDARWVQSLMNELIERYFGRSDIEFVFTDLADDDELSQVQADQEAMFAGQKSLDQILQERGEDPVGVDRFVVIGNVPWSIADLKAIQDPEGDGKDYERQPAPGIPIWDDGEDEPAALPAGGTPDTPPLGGPGQQPLPPVAGPQGQDERARGEAGSSPASPDGGSSSEQDARQDTPRSTDREGRQPAERQARERPAGGQSEPLDEKDAKEKFDTDSGFQPAPSLDPRGARPDVDELRRWKRYEVKAARAGRRSRPFVTDLLPDAVKTAIVDGLTTAEDVLDVRVLFDREIAALEKAAHPMGQQGLQWAHYRAADTARACRVCEFFAGQPNQLGACSMFDAEVRPDYTCDQWAFDTDTRKAAAVTAAAEVAGVCVRAADTGRILMLQRSIADADDPARGTWEFPGGHLEDDEQPLEGAIREWQEETGAQLPPGTLAGSFRNGIYECFVYVVPVEADVPLNLPGDDRDVVNPDDPDGDDVETLAWWAPSDARENPALRDEAKDSTDWDLIDRAVPGAQFKLAGVLIELAKAAQPSDDDTERERRIKLLAAAAATALAAHAATLYGVQVDRQRVVDEFIGQLRSHYRQALAAGSSDAADRFLVDRLADDELDRIAEQRAEQARGTVSELAEQASIDEVKAATISALARGVKAAYEEGYGRTVVNAHPDAICVWVADSDPCDLCGAKDGEVFTADTLPGYPGDGGYGDTCEGGPNCRCELEWRIPSGVDDEDAE